MPKVSGGMMAPVDDGDDGMVDPHHVTPMAHHERPSDRGALLDPAKQHHIAEAHDAGDGGGEDDGGATGFVTKVKIGMIIRRWKIVSKIGAGSFGETFAGVEVNPLEDDPHARASPQPSSSPPLPSTGSSSGPTVVLDQHGRPKEVCVKVEQESKNVLRLEVLALKKAQPCPQVVRYIASGRCADANYMVMERLGPNLVELRRTSSRGVFSIYTMLRVGISCVQAIKGVHELGLLHRDIKPSNFVIGLEGDAARTCYLIDFGLARRYRRSNGDVRAPRDDAGFRGTSRYASLRSHQHLDLGRVDDLWSLLFMLIEFATGTLPWRKYKEKDDIGRCKQETIGPALVKNLPREFAAVLDHLQSVGYATAPKYDFIIALLQHALERRGYPPGKLLDWEDQQQQAAVEASSHRSQVAASDGVHHAAPATPPRHHSSHNRQEHEHSEPRPRPQVDVQVPADGERVRHHQHDHHGSDGLHHSDAHDGGVRSPSVGAVQSHQQQATPVPHGSLQRPGDEDGEGDSIEEADRPHGNGLVHMGDRSHGGNGFDGIENAALVDGALVVEHKKQVDDPLAVPSAVAPTMVAPAAMQQQGQPVMIESIPAFGESSDTAAAHPHASGPAHAQQLFPDFDDGCEALFVLQPADGQHPRHDNSGRDPHDKLASDMEDDAVEPVSRGGSGSQRTVDSARSGRDGRGVRLSSKSGLLLEQLSVRLSPNAQSPCKGDLSSPNHGHHHHVFSIPSGASLAPPAAASATTGPLRGGLRAMHPIPPTQHSPGIVEEGRTSSTSGFVFSPRDEVLEVGGGSAAPPMVVVPLPVVSVTRHRPVGRDARHKEYTNPMPPTAMHTGSAGDAMTSVGGQAVPSSPGDPTGVDGDPVPAAKEETACSCAVM